MSISGVAMRPVGETDAGWIEAFMVERWGDRSIISRGIVHYPAELPGFVALYDAEIAGLLTYRLARDECEIVTLDSLRSSIGIGSALIESAARKARQEHCRRLWLITTNDNLNALRFYQKRGFVLAALHANALEKSRQLKPQIPLIGHDGIPLRDEIELSMAIGGS